MPTINKNAHVETNLKVNDYVKYNNRLYWVIQVTNDGSTPCKCMALCESVDDDSEIFVAASELVRY